MDECDKGVPWESSQEDSMLFPSLPLSWMPESLGRTAKQEDTIAVLPQTLTSIYWEGQRPNTPTALKVLLTPVPLSLTSYVIVAFPVNGRCVTG